MNSLKKIEMYKNRLLIPTALLNSELNLCFRQYALMKLFQLRHLSLSGFILCSTSKFIFGMWTLQTN